MTLGFTGTSKGMTQRQRDTVLYLFRELQLTELHHGGERHADAEAHRLALALGACVHVHPGPAFKLSHDCLGADVVHAIKPNLTRNKDIVTMSVDGLVAAPSGATEVLRSGTWTTVRYARKAERRRWIVSPDGTFREELITGACCDGNDPACPIHGVAASNARQNEFLKNRGD